MRRIIAIGVTLAALAGPLHAQGSKPGFGVGVSLDLTPTGDFSLFEDFRFPGRTGNLHFPIRISPSFRLEPMLGYAHEHQKSAIGGSTFDMNATLWRLGVGFLYQLRPKGDFQAYSGARIGIRRRSQKITQTDPSFPPPVTNKASQTDKFLAAVFGGEFSFSPNFSLGGEAQLSYTDLGDVKISETPPPPFPQPNISESGSQLETAGLIVVRWYP